MVARSSCPSRFQLRLHRGSGVVSLRQLQTTPEDPKCSKCRKTEQTDKRDRENPSERTFRNIRVYSNNIVLSTASIGIGIAK